MWSQASIPHPQGCPAGPPIASAPARPHLQPHRLLMGGAPAAANLTSSTFHHGRRWEETVVFALTMHDVASGRQSRRSPHVTLPLARRCGSPTARKVLTRFVQGQQEPVNNV